MPSFSPEDIDEIDRLWRGLPADHMWTGWAAAGERPEVVWIFRTLTHWRRFPLRRTETGYALSDDRGNPFREAATLEDLLQAVEAVPQLGVRPTG
ncbi:MAG TPA: hypothetical protein PKV67_14230 [Hyphomonas sp.]|uniref:hypothetical protein n=1 Tax=Hyphomonas sp. TaxID=87 RepID=UPI000E7EBB7D|nr:hypothetical protein [Hyphomonas sp.]HRJ01908.1 hypothetical protein [Hyphomonas sp.]